MSGQCALPGRWAVRPALSVESSGWDDGVFKLMGTPSWSLSVLASYALCSCCACVRGVSVQRACPGLCMPK